jgi:hypothetical protein
MWVKVGNFQPGDAPTIGYVGTKSWTHTFTGNTSGWEKFSQIITGASLIKPEASYEDSSTTGGYLLIDDITIREVPD